MIISFLILHILKTIEIKSLCDKILTFKIHDISEQKLSSSLTKKSKATSLEEIKKTLIQMNSILKKETNLSKNQKDIFVFLSDKGLEKLTDMIKSDNSEISKLSFQCLVNILYKNVADKNDTLILIANTII